MTTQQWSDTTSAPFIDTSLEDVVHSAEAVSDSILAELIELDGRTQRRAGRRIEFDRYLRLIPDLTSRPDVLDAALDMALRDLARTARIGEEAVQVFSSRYPQFSRAIAEVAALNNALWTSSTPTTTARDVATTALPRDFGPELDGNVSRYELVELLGAGTFGHVYLAVDRLLSDKDHPAFVAIKLLNDQAHSEMTRMLLAREAAKARRIDHPNVVRVLDRGTSPSGIEYIVHEYVDDGDLISWARRFRRTSTDRQLAAIVVNIARGVHAAHMAGVVHLDLKPSNIVMSADHEPKVADFGVAVRVSESDAHAAPGRVSAAPVGNLAFMSPEQFRMDDGALTIPTDVYALGGILYWLLTGRLPNGRSRDEIRRSHTAQTTGAPPRLAEPHWGNADLQRILDRAMAAAPARRFASAAEFADSLECWISRRPLSWSRPAMLHRARLWARRSPLGVVVAGVIVALVAASGLTGFHAAVAHEGLDAEREIRAKFRTKLHQIRDRLEEAKSNGLSHEVLPQIWLEEWMFNSLLRGEDADGLRLWELRKEAIGELLAAARRSGGERSFNTLLWEFALTFWHIHDREYDEAAPILQATLAKSRDMLDADDPWLLQLAALEACLDIGRASRRGDPGGAAGTAGLERAAGLLELTEAMLAEQERKGPLHYLVVDHLVKAYDPCLLDRPDPLAAARYKLAIITE